jgi:hypothetical protein
MHTLLTTVALIVAAPAASWENDYSNGQQLAAAQKKPLVVVFGPGANGWTKVVRTESPAPELTKLLAEQYVCVFVDTSTSAGSKLAEHFEVAGGVGVVISDRTGGSQAFWHQGDLTNDSFVSYLAKYADPTVVVARTETVNSPRTSYYPPGAYQSNGFPSNGSGYRSAPAVSC